MSSDPPFPPSWFWSWCFAMAVQREHRTGMASHTLHVLTLSRNANGSVTDEQYCILLNFGNKEKNKYISKTMKFIQD